MKTIFIVMENWIDYDGGTSTPILATFDRDTANSTISKLELKKHARNKMNTVVEQHMDDWDKENPRPVNVSRRIKKDDASITEFSEWINDRYNEYKSFLGSFTDEEQKDFDRLNDKLYWGIEEVPFK